MRMIPILSPAGVQEIIDYGLMGFALSRFAGLWVGLKCVKDTVESTATIDGSLDRMASVIPGALPDAAGRPQHPAAATTRSRRRSGSTSTRSRRRSPSSGSTCPTGWCSPAGARRGIGIITAGKSYLDVLQALDELGIDEGDRRRFRHQAPQARLHLADRAGDRPPLRRAAREDHRRRGEARPDRGPGQGDPLRHAEPAGDRRQDATRPATGCSRRRARSTPTASPSPSASGCSSTAPHRGLEARVAALKQAEAGARRGQGHRHPRLLFLRRLPLQQRHRRARRLARLCRHRLPLHGASAWTGRPRATPRWAPRAPTGSARRRSRRAAMSSRTSATAPTTTRAASPSAPRRSPASTSPTASTSTTRWR